MPSESLPMGEYVIGLADGALKLRKARDAGMGVSLTIQEVRALCEALQRLAQRGRDDHE
jgi:hypothetical protein